MTQLKDINFVWLPRVIDKKKVLTMIFFSLIVLFISICLLLFIVAHLNLELHKFFNGELDEVLYVQQLIGSNVLAKENKVHKLQHSMYYLKQLSKQ